MNSNPEEQSPESLHTEKYRYSGDLPNGLNFVFGAIREVVRTHDFTGDPQNVYWQSLAMDWLSAGMGGMFGRPMRDNPAHADLPQTPEESYETEINRSIQQLRTQGLSDTRIRARLARKYHPDVQGGNNEAMQYVNIGLGPKIRT